MTGKKTFKKLFPPLKKTKLSEICFYCQAQQNDHRKRFFFFLNFHGNIKH